MDVQEAVSESQHVASADDNGDGKRDGQRRFTMGPNDSLEGKLVYDGHVHVDGRAEGEFRVTGNLDVASGATARILIEATNVTLKGTVEGSVAARDKLTLGRGAKLSGDIAARRLQIDDAPTPNGHAPMCAFSPHRSVG